jgi:hypothetical protein
MCGLLNTVKIESETNGFHHTDHTWAQEMWSNGRLETDYITGNFTIWTAEQTILEWSNQQEWYDAGKLHV